MAAAAVLVLGATLAVAGPAGGAPADRGDPADHWTSSRRAAAIPRDLVLDERGLAYLQRPDGRLVPYGHDVPARAPELRAEPAAGSRPAPGGKPSGGDDSTGPVIGDRAPADGATIGTSATFSATVTDPSGVKTVSFVVVYPDGRTQSFAGAAAGEVWSVTLSGFSAGQWGWYVVATDGARRGGNTSTSDTWTVTVGTTSPPPPDSDVVTNARWTADGVVQRAAGRIYFEMPANKRHTRWQGYVCSGTAIAGGDLTRSIILTAAHCVYDDQYKAFARNVLFIPDQDGSTAGTDRDCSNDPIGCWAPTVGVVDDDWAARTFPDNIPWDYGYYAIPDSGAHSGTAATSEALDAAVTPMSVQLDPPSTGVVTHALGYSYSDDPNFMYCAEPMGTEGAANWWLPSCGLSGGSSGGPWVQPLDAATGDGPVISVNSWGYTNQPGMAGPKLNGTSAGCLLSVAGTTALTSPDRGVAPAC